MSKQTDRPVYAVVDSFTQRIASGELPAGTQLPTVAQLAVDLGMSRATVDRAMMILQDRRLIQGEQGKARWVRWDAQPRAKQRLADDAAEGGCGGQHGDGGAGGPPQIRPGDAGEDPGGQVAAAP